MRNNRRVPALLLVLAASLPCAGGTFEPRELSGLESPHEAFDLPPIIAHQALGTGAPGNTLEAVRRHLDSGIEGLEIDVRLSKDGVPVLFHDDRMEESTDGDGTIEGKSWDEISRVKYRNDISTMDCGIARLDEVLGLVGPAKYLFLDIKESGVKDNGFAKALADLIKEHGLYRTVIVESFNPAFLAHMRKADPHVRLMFDFADESRADARESQGQLASIPWLLKQEWFRRGVRGAIQPDLLGPRRTVPLERLRDLAGRGYPLVAWTVDDPKEAQALLKAGVAGVQSNEPFLLESRLVGLSRKLDDASRLNAVSVGGVVRVRSEEDVCRALARAHAEGRKISIAGRRHSMGGQTLGEGHLILDMTPFKSVAYGSSGTMVTAQAGAAWADLQRKLDPFGRAIKVMQSDTIFTVGGSLSVNAHGWQPVSGPVAATVRSLRVMKASGEVVECSREKNRDLFRAVLGGYGLLGVILDATLETAPNEAYRKRSAYFPAERYAERFAVLVDSNPLAGLAYGRLSVDRDHLLTEAGLHVYEKVDPQPAALAPMSDESFVRLKRRVFRASERSEAGKRRRWLLERDLSPALEKGTITRNTVMHPDIHVLWPEDLSRRDVLHEYFVPRAAFAPFISGLRSAIQVRKANLLNVTIRDVRKDTDTLLAYAREDSFAFVLFFSQEPAPDAEEAMRTLTGELIDLARSLGGSFYLPYRLHSSREQVRAAYPGLDEFLALKKSHDPEGLFSSLFFRHISP